MEQINYELMYKHERTHWWYRVRRSLVRFLISKYVGTHDLRILDVGCGTGLLLTELSSFGDVRGIDVSPTAIDFCRERGVTNVSISDGVSIPFSDNEFDVVLALDVIEHIADDVGAVAEIHRVLKPGGVAIIFVPAFRFLWGITDELSQHHRRYTLRELRLLFSGKEYLTLRSSYFNMFLFLPILLVRWTVRLLRLHPQSELDVNNRVLNEVLFCVFYLDYLLLKVISLPIGVSILMVARKNV